MKAKLESGFVLVDVLLALFLFTLGFASVYGLSAGALKEGEEALRITEGANMAQSLMESLANEDWNVNLATGKCIPDGAVQGKEGLFQWKITAEWVIPERLLQVNVDITWPERRKNQNYSLSSMFAL